MFTRLSTQYIRNNKTDMETYTLTEQQIRLLLSQSFDMGYLLTMNMVNKTERNAWCKDMIESEVDALNDICEDVLSETPEARKSLRIY